MKVLVTGATGQLGVQVVERLLAGGHEVLAASQSGRAPAGSSLGRPSVLQFELGDEAAVSTLRAHLGSDVALVHLAARRVSGETSATERSALFEDNVLGTQRVLEAARGGSASVVVYACDAEVYGSSNALLNERSHLQPLTDYAATKLSGEDHLFAFEFEEQTRCVSLRFGALYGPGRRTQDALGRVLASQARGEPVELRAHATERRARIHVRDAAEAVERALLEPVRGRFNVCDGQPHVLADDVALAIRVAGGAVPASFVTPPSAPLRLELDVTRAHDELGFRPRGSLEAAFLDAWRELRSQP